MDEPTLDQLNRWFEVLHRFALLSRDDPLEPIFAPKPLRADIQECCERGWVRAWVVAGQEDHPQRARLLLTPEGREVYAQWCDALAAAGRPPTGYPDLARRWG
jgi:hypothetical protein